MKRPLFLLLALAGVAAVPPPEAPSECGERIGLPALSLEDVNPTSPTYGETVALDTTLHQITVIYWAQAT